MTPTRRNQVSDWATWFVRLMIPAILLGGWQAYEELKAVETDLKLVSQQIDGHTRSLAAIWKRLNENHYAPPSSPQQPP